jgi:hypothetical protein
MRQLLTAIFLKPVCDMYAMLSTTFAIAAVSGIIAVFSFGRISLNFQFLLF